MSDSQSDELEEIRERKKQELREQRGGEGNRSGGTPAPSDPIEVSGHDHLNELLNTHNVVLLDCYADWCGPCKMMEPTIESIAGTNGAAVAKLDVDAHQQIAAQLGAQSIPTLILYVDGEPVERLVGAQDHTTLEGLIADYT